MTKAEGKSPFTVNSQIFFKSLLSATNTFASGAYSRSNCRQAPHGIGPSSQRATTATATKLFFTSVRALNSAMRSAQHVKP